MLAVSQRESHSFAWDRVWTVVEVLAAVLYLLEFFGVLDWFRGRLHKTRPSITPVGRVRFFSIGRIIVFTGLFLSLTMGFTPSHVAKLALAGALLFVVVGKETYQWRREVAQARLGATVPTES